MSKPKKKKLWIMKVSLDADATVVIEAEDEKDANATIYNMDADDFDIHVAATPYGCKEVTHPDHLKGFDLDCSPANNRWADAIGDFFTAEDIARIEEEERRAILDAAHHKLWERSDDPAVQREGWS